MPLLNIESVSVSFGGLQALSDVTIDVEPGMVTGLIGPNGAGKTTLFNVITGLQPPTSGLVSFDGQDISKLKPHKRARVGMARTFQRLEAFGSLSVRDNILVAAEMRQGWSRESFDPSQVADELLERIKLGDVREERVDTLPTGTARLVELARALAAKPRLLLLDEPSSGLNEEETDEMSALLLDLVGDGLAVLLVEHDMPFVMETCARIHVLDFGRIIATGTPHEIQGSDVVRAAYLGADEASDSTSDSAPESATESATRTTPRIPAATGIATPPVAVDLRDIRAGYGNIEVLRGVTLALHVGEVIALLGPNGAGKSTTLKVLSGQVIPTSGEYEAFGRLANGAATDSLCRAGICTIPEGRGVFPNLTVTENLRMMTHSGTEFAAIKERAFAQFPRLKERQKQVAGTMSGGEQQMLAIARALGTNPRVLLLDELSMGLAPLIVEELYEIVAQIARSGVTILIIEQFAHDVLHIAHQAAIMLHGRIQEIGDPHTIADQLAEAYLGS